MRSIRRLQPALIALGLTCLVLGLTGSLAGAATSPRQQQDDGQLIAQGRDLYVQGCSSCHGVDLAGYVTPEGERRGPSLRQAGAAAAYYALSTGRMPAAQSTGQIPRKEPAYDDEEIAALVAYVASESDGPDIPEVDLNGADVSAGGELYRSNCQACHSAFGSGGALSYGYSAPALHSATPLEIGSAVRAGPGLMPVFGPDVISDTELSDVVAYVEYLDRPATPGGLQIGRNGPVPEGFVIWLVGVGACILVVTWIGTRDPVRRAPDRDSEAHEGSSDGL